MSRRVPVVLVTLLALAACGGGDDESSGGAASNDEWCVLAQQIDDQSGVLDGSLDAGGAEFDQALDEFGSLLSQALAIAPDEISDALMTISDGSATFRELVDGADDSGFDEAVLAELAAAGEQMVSATEQVEAYNLRECGIDPGPDDLGEASEFAASTLAEDDLEGVELGDDLGVDQGVEIAGEPAVDDSADEAGDDDGSADDLVFVGDSDSDWCVAARQVEEASDDLESIGFADPAEVEAALGEVLDLFGNAVQYAPPELAADLEVSLESFQKVDDALRAADYDFLNADLSALDDLDGSVARANERIEQYNVQVCGFEPAADEVFGDDDSGFDPSAGTIREQTVAELVNQGFTADEAECIIDKIDFTDPDLIADTSAIIAIFDECDISLARLAELAG